jgi:hypothetical protein
LAKTRLNSRGCSCAQRRNVGGLGHPLGGGLVDLEGDQVDQLLVARDVAVEGRRREAHPARDCAQRQLGAFAQQLAGDAHDLGVGLLALALPARRSAHHVAHCGLPKLTVDTKVYTIYGERRSQGQ